MATKDKIAKITIEVRDQIYPVDVSERGWFSASNGDRDFSAETLEKLREQMVTASRRRAVKVAVPMTRIVGKSWGSQLMVATPITVTGIHGRTDELLYRDDKTGKADTLTYGETNDLLGPMTAEERAEHDRLAAKYAEAFQALKAFKEAHEFPTYGVRKVVEQAIQQAMEKEKAS